MKRIAVIGNGFDLSCGLESRYSDFFKDRIKSLFGKFDNYDVIRISLEQREKNNEWNEKKFDRFLASKSNWPNGITRWDCIFIYAEKFLDNGETKQWQDVENIIFNVVSIALWPANSSEKFKTNLLFKGSSTEEKQANEEKFYNMVMCFAGSESDSLEKKANNLLQSLNEFERIFSEYILGDSNQKEASYKSEATDLIKVLAGWENSSTSRSTLDVLSFNYSLDARFGKELQDKGYPLNSWTNIHGLASYRDKNAEGYINRIQKKRLKKLPAPIFGIDNHDILRNDFPDDLRLLFTKSYRLVNNNIISMIQTDTFANAECIMFYGHSLGRADYSYFETLFDDSNLYNSQTKLIFYYYEEDNPLTSREQYTSDVVRLLTSYGQTLSNIHGENIVNKLVLEHRLEVLPYPEF